jgi:hypothetical protein
MIPLHPEPGANKQPGPIPLAGERGSGNALRKLAAAAIVVAGLVLLVTIYALGLTPVQVTQRDYIEYWAAGQQLVHHADPYNFAASFQLERQNGMRTSEPRVCFSPPVALELVLPLGRVKAKTGLIVWLVAELGCVLLSIWLLWRQNGKPDTRVHLLALAFAPVVACQMAGQIGAFFLLCFVLFMEFHRRRPLLAGAVLMPFALKPHLFVPFAVALFIWCIFRRRLRILAGAFCALAVSCAASLAIDPRAWTQYSHMTSTYPLMDWFVPTLGMGLRYLVDRPARWIGFLPEAAGCGWAVWYAWRHRKSWDWMEHGQLVMLVSVVCAPYSWVSDQCLLLPAILTVIFQSARRGRMLLLFLLIDVVMLAQVMTAKSMTSWWFVWTAPAWLAWYLYATRLGPQQPITAAAGS